MGERDRSEELGEEGGREAHGQRIPGRDFAGASYASTEREQTRDHRGTDERDRAGEGEGAGAGAEEPPADES